MLRDKLLGLYFLISKKNLKKIQKFMQITINNYVLINNC